MTDPKDSTKSKNNALSEPESAEDRVGDEEQSQQRIEIQNVDDDKADKEEEELAAAPSRETWGSQVSYILTLVGYAVGFGNIWRFPYQMRENGGLVFLIPYTIMLAVLGIPIFFLELAVGQRRRKAVVYAWAEISPRLGGIGIACGWLCFLVGLYYNTLIAYCLSYFVDSYRSPLPWTNCATAGENIKGGYQECMVNVGDRSTKYYWFRKTLDISPRYEEPGNYNWYLCLYIIIAWVSIYAILIKGTQSMGIMVYFTAIFPYLVLLIFFIGNCFIEPGKAWLGAYRLLKPDWKALYNPITWLKAGSQIFFSLGLAVGCLVVFASYNPARNNCYKDSIYISLINCSTSMFAALVVFPMIGALGHRKYEECIKEMAPFFMSSRIISSFDEKYDIFFFTAAKSWAAVDNRRNNITIAYGYGEINGVAEKAEWWNHFQPSEKHKFDLIDQIGLNKTKIANLAKSPTHYLRDCSIGMEATASGGGTGFVFLAFTQAVLGMPYANFWSVLFFCMLLFLGIDSGFGTVEGAVAALGELIHSKRWVTTTWVCGVMMTIAILLFPFGWGANVLDLMDQWTADWALLVIALLQCIAVAWDYGLAKISYDIRLMTGSKPHLYILLCWKYISPTVILMMLAGSIAQFIVSTVAGGGFYYTAFDPKNKNSVNGDLKLPMPPHIIATGLLLMVGCVIWVPLHCVLRKTKYNMLKAQAYAEFPEEELRQERSINVLREEDQFTDTEKMIMGTQSIQSLQEYRDQQTSRSLISMDRIRTSGSGISLGGSSTR